MRKLEMRKAKRQALPFKGAMMGVSNAGKTASALIFAYEYMGRDWSKVYLVDTEHERSLMYVGQTIQGIEIGEFNHIPFDPPYDAELWEQALEMVEKDCNGDGFIIFDSFSHEWDGVGGIADRGMSGEGRDKFTAWKEPKHDHKRLVDKIMRSPLNVICTIICKDKLNIVPGAGEGGRTLVETLPEAPVQDKTLRREFQIVWLIDDNHIARVTKDNTQLLEGMNTPIKPEYAVMVRDFLKEGVKVKSLYEQQLEEQARIQKMREEISALAHEHQEVAKLLGELEVKARKKIDFFPPAWLEEAHKRVMKLIDKMKEVDEIDAEQVAVIEKVNDERDREIEEQAKALVAEGNNPKVVEVWKYTQLQPKLEGFVQSFLKGHRVDTVEALEDSKLDLLLSRLSAKMKA